jgi:hypothetical protein
MSAKPARRIAYAAKMLNANEAINAQTSIAKFTRSTAAPVHIQCADGPNVRSLAIWLPRLLVVSPLPKPLSIFLEIAP